MSKMAQSRLKQITLTILTGIVFGTSYIPFPGWGIFICFALLWAIWFHCSSASQVWWTGWGALFVGTLIGFNWVAYTIHEFGHLPWWAATLGLFAFSSFANIHFPLAGVGWWLICQHLKLPTWGKWLLLPVLTALAERVYPMIFDWNFGYVWLWMGWPGLQWADVIGFLGLSTLSMMVNLALLAIWTYRKQRWSWGLALSLMLFMIAFNWTGFLRKKAYTSNLTESAHIMIVQGNVGNLEKQSALFGPRFRQKILSDYLTLTRQSLQSSPPLLFAVWPEAAFPDNPEDARSYLAYQLREFLRQNDLYLITGGYSELQDTGQVTNSLFTLSPDGHSTSPPYHKTILLAFGEYIPGSKWFPILREWLPMVADFGRGPGPTVQEIHGKRIGSQICYEGLFDRFTRKLAQSDPHFLINLTNDSWYGKWQQPYQHLYMTLARAIEVRRPLIRATNTGFSSVILADGTILEKSPLHEPWSKVYEIKYSPQPANPPFVTYGYYMIPLLLMIILCVIIFVGIVRNEINKTSIAKKFFVLFNAGRRRTR